jgi:3-hydroxyacyl-CoA dehydrogenase/enoyl-CoA hydratase/3-hydroxybutyryl-CoA epimerase
LGIHPGFGGTVRLVALVGAPKALDLMLTGRSASPVEALEMGLIDRTSAADALEKTAADLLNARPAPHRAPWHLRLLQKQPFRALLALMIERRVSRRARPEHYPAPYALLELWRRHGGEGDRAYSDEADSIGRLLVTPTCQNLVRVFLLRERLRNLAPKSDAIEHIHVVGAGVMGGDIASWCALRGLDVTLQDRADEYVRPAIERARKLFDRRLKAPGAAAEAAARLRVDIEGRNVEHADVVLEAIVEKLDVKQQLYADLEPRCKEGAVLATNTSSLRIEDLAANLARPDRFVGLHFFNPVAQLPLVEVIRGEATSDATLREALAFVVQIGKLPLPCRSAPGFLVNRVLTPYMLEALRAHEDGHSLETVDAAAKQFGMPMGPVELADRVGLDVALSVAKIMSAVLRSEPPALLEAMVSEGRLGVKSGHGFYRYEHGRPQKQKQYARPDDDLTDRLMLPLLNEAVACLHEGVVEDADLADAGVVFGTGFAPFRGGPLQYARQRGVRDIVARLEALAERHGPRFKPHPGWDELIPNP